MIVNHQEDMRSVLPLLFVLLMVSMFVSSHVVAKDWTESISCGNAIIDISMSEKEEGIKIWDVELNGRPNFKKNLGQR